MPRQRYSTLGQKEAAEAQRLERSLSENEQRYALVSQAVAEGIYDWNIELNSLFVSPRLMEIFSFEGVELTSKDWYERVHPDDKEGYRTVLRDCFKQRTSKLECQYRIRAADGGYRWVEDHGLPIRNETGRAIRLVGAVSDISRRRQMEQALLDSEQRYALAMQAVNEGVYDWNIATDDIYYSPSVRNALGLTPEMLRSRTDWLDRVHPDDLAAYKKALAAHLKGETDRLMCEYRYRHPDGTWHWARQHGIALRDQTGHAFRLAGSTGDITVERHLLDELRQRTADLGESLEQQTTTAEILSVISKSLSDAQPVFDAIVRSGVRLFSDAAVVLALAEQDMVKCAAVAESDPNRAEQWRRRFPFPLTREYMHSTVILDCRMLDIPDVENAPDEMAAGRRNFLESGYRAITIMPLTRGETAIGALSAVRVAPGPLSEKQLAALKTYASQAAIAIENARLLNELRQRTDELGRSVGELRALGEVSQAVNSTLELETVLSTIVAKAVQLSGTEAGAIYSYDEWTQEFRLRATYGMNRQLIDALTEQHIGFSEPNVALAFAQREPIEAVDLKDEVRSEVNDIIVRAGYRARLVAPLLRGDDIVGMLAVRRKLPGQFAPGTIDLIKTFAAQSALAILNAQLFDSVETRTRELSKTLQDLRTTQDRLVQTQKLASLGQLTAGIAHEIKNPLNFVNNFSGVSVELIDELQETLGRVTGDKKTRDEIAELAVTLRNNLDKIVQHGKRADSIVKNMLMHSREGSGEHRLVDINALVDESLNLAYHGARAEKQGFEMTLERSFDPAAGTADLYPQDITRVLLNVIANGFYAAIKRNDIAADGHQPTLSATTRDLGDRVEIRVRDNGTGIPADVKEKMFNPFFTTKPAGEGTGLGLSISHDIIVKQHSGTIEVETEPGEFTEIRIVLPRAASA